MKACLKDNQREREGGGERGERGREGGRERQTVHYGAFHACNYTSHLTFREAVANDHIQEKIIFHLAILYKTNHQHY